MAPLTLAQYQVLMSKFDHAVLTRVTHTVNKNSWKPKEFGSFHVQWDSSET